MKKLDPYLNFHGNTEEVFLFYKSVFGGEFTSLIRFGELPGSEKMSETDKSKIFNVTLPIGEFNVLMGTDILESMNQNLNVGDNFHINVTLDTENETRQIFERLSERGQIIMPLAKEDWSQLFGMCKDQFGIQWMIKLATN
ncbi:VOC family protein [Pedobacter heparinus]|uniref:Glyoxalase/bleomycin resistance protein/dioxygenase n=1 Tax=Pedobacter heparinus (strain ATCC 13125 / DSM 2366 / CIP 104194 / JCM 7457 / NBRC 12017 / NCIMB 9290 / NRRL B-14731 / HIM 762-3) TaxID=485917 RepID=C6XVB6_PEDHD|nr:VOC family protein [Pedobacter heparinus]ACU03982.1 Glyoxalase/bleomycin resistance protein/dioxygenase [Pedobacter heparinus DSM 2366]